MDPQGHSTLGLLTGSAQLLKTMYDVLLQYGNGRETGVLDIVRSIHTNLDLAPADILLSALPESLAGVPNREGILKNVLEPVRSRYDYIIIDCPPHVGLLTFNALTACTETIVPVDPSFFSLHGIGKLLETFDVLARKTGHEIAVRALITLYSGRSQFAREVVDELRTHFAGRCFNTIIRYSVKLAEAASHGLPIAGYCHRCAGFQDYEALASEVVQMEDLWPESDRSRDVAGGNGHSSRPSPPVQTPDGVLFAFEAPDARQVQLVGDFNGWTLDGNEMRRAGSVWRSMLRLEPGRYRYRYVIDGEWRSDPLNGEVEPSPFGGHNSVLVVAERSPREPLDVI